MKIIKTTSLLFILSLLSACGAQLVEFGDADGGGGRLDGGNLGSADGGPMLTDAGSGNVADAGPPPTPTVTSTTPGTGALGVGTGVSPTATFSTTMDMSTLTSATVILKHGSAVMTTTVSTVGNVVTIDPAAALDTNTFYTVAITTAASSSAGRPLAANYSWSFTTEPAPAVVSTTPAPTAMGVGLSTSPTATFSTVMDPATITDLTFTLKQGSAPIVGVVTYAGRKATFNPTTNLTAGLFYTATVTTGAASLAGTPIALAATWASPSFVDC